MNIPNELKYTEDHEWIRVDGDIATIGVSEFASNELGDVVYVEFQESDEDVESGDAIGSIEAVKTVSDMFAPVAGTVIEFNEELGDAPETINEDPYGKGWIAKIKIKDHEDIKKLMDADAYKAHIG